ncbi:transcription initiation factor TAFII31 [Kickxella alabastrina]|uniref:transcription initiation factor TAFII31 n=1 Tax=Kickxella alabastrina TaxID=61397 RepID=UPI00221E512D|nr:transcription initiation factor TAFII31 [Kickxella alabastrina]KAI7830970.1 transcription initiation factor TAFII31 [Kickxella alabastrina]
MMEETPNKPDETPRDYKIMALLLQSHGIEDCDPSVINQLLEFSHRYTVDVLQDALDVRLAIQGRVNYSFTSPPEKEFLLELADERNKHPLPLIPEKYGVRLPPEKYTLTGVNFHIVPDPRSQAAGNKPANTHPAA